jgi:competence ComEA-like helix-hairpin-helix protein
MSAKAEKLAAQDVLVDVNEATAEELRCLLPGIGEVLAERIVEYRQVHGSFADLGDLAKVPGIYVKRLSRMSQHISPLSPTSGTRPAVIVSPMLQLVPALPSSSAAPPSPPLADEVLREVPASVLREPGAPSLDSLLPDTGERERMIGGSLLPATHTPDRVRHVVVDSDDELVIPLHRPLRVWLAVAAVTVLSALAGTTLGIRSQAGGPRGALERRVGRVQDDVADVKGSVKDLQGQTQTLGVSINALDARLAEQEKSAARSQKPGPARR